MLSLFLLISCQDENDKIKGEWIEKDNFKNPNILKIYDYYFTYNTNLESDKNVYHFANDTFYVSDIRQIHKTIVRVKNDELLLIDVETDTIISAFERFNNRDFVGYFNTKKKTNISLPKLADNNGSYLNFQNILYADYKGDTLSLFFNGKAHELTDTSYKTLEIKNYENNCQLIIDKDIKVYDINKIKTELRKARQKTVLYTVYNQNDSLINLVFQLAPIKIPGKLPPPPPPTLHLNKKKTKEIHLDIARESITIEGKQIRFNQLEEVLTDLIYSNKYARVIVYFDEQLKYENYIKHLSAIQGSLREAKNRHAMVNFHVSDYNELEYKDAKQINKMFSLTIKEQDIEPH